MEFAQPVILGSLAIIGGLTVISTLAWALANWAQDWYDRGR